MDYLTEANGQTYSSKDNYAAADAYRSSDHDPIVVGLNLLPPNVAPEQTRDIPAISVTRLNQSLLIDLADYVTDADGDALSYSLVSAPEGLVLDGNGVFSGRADRDVLAQLPANALIEVSDGVESITVSVMINDDRPARSFWDFLLSLFSWLWS